MFLADQILESAVTDASRLIRTGQAQSSGLNATTFQAEVCKRLYILFDCTQLRTDVQVVSNFSSVSLSPPVNTTTGNFTGTPTYSAGTGSQIVVVSVYYQYPMLFNNFGWNMADLANSKRLLGAVAAFRNEPFP